MKNYKDSDYAINRYSKGIVYNFADGNNEITLEKFIEAHPELSEADFNTWKQWSNDDYENSTTSNIYTHLDFNSKISSANAIIGVFPSQNPEVNDQKQEEYRQ